MRGGDCGFALNFLGYRLNHAPTVIRVKDVANLIVASGTESNWFGMAEAVQFLVNRAEEDPVSVAQVLRRLAELPSFPMTTETVAHFKEAMVSCYRSGNLEAMDCALDVERQMLFRERVSFANVVSSLRTPGV
jgi:hypothetical protein